MIRSRTARETISTSALACADVTAIVVSSSLALGAAAYLSVTFGGSSISDLSKLVADRLPSMVPAFLLFIHLCNRKSHYTGRPQFWDEAHGILVACMFAALTEGFLQYAVKEEGSRLWTMVGWTLLPFVVVAARTTTKLILLRSGLWRRSVVVIGRQYEASLAADALLSDRLMGYEVASVHDGVGTTADIMTLVEATSAEHVLVALSESGEGVYSNIARELARKGVSYSVAVPPMGMANTLTRSSAVFGHDVMFLQEARGLTKPFARMAKRMIDVVGSLVVLVLVSPILAVATVAASAEGGNPIYGHRRVGRNGREFTCLKFRTMRNGSDRLLADHLAGSPEARTEWKRTGKLAVDPRITRWGRLLRKTSIDELPQLVNVLRGEMSLVGPRPVTSSELSEHYAGEEHVYGMARPGMTGYWQSSGRNEIGYARRVAMDGWYVRNWSMWLDCVLVMKTIPILVNRRGAT